MMFWVTAVAAMILIGISKARFGGESKLPAAAGVVLGGLAGFTSTLAHAGGAPATIYLLPQQLPLNIFVGASVLFFFVVNLVKLIPYSALAISARY